LKPGKAFAAAVHHPYRSSVLLAMKDFEYQYRVVVAEEKLSSQWDSFVSAEFFLSLE